MTGEGETAGRPGGLAGFEAELDSRLGTFVKRADQALMAAKGAALAPHNLTVAQYSTLMLLDFVPEASAAQLSRACLVTPQTMATVVANLEEKGYVARRPSPLHRRVLGVRLTDAGRGVVRAADRDAKAVESRLASVFTPAESELLRHLLVRAAEILAATISPGQGG